MESLEWWELIPRAFMRIGGRYLLLAGVAFVVFYVWKRQSWLSRKIQPRFPKNADYRRELGYSLATVAFFAVVSSFLLFDEQVRPYTRLMAAPDALGWGYYWGIFPVLLFLHDTYFYWAHRWMHLPYWYRSVHRIHHQSTNPSPWAAYAFHPWEALVEIGILPLFVFAIPLHRTHLLLFFLFMIAYNVYGHLGYELYPKGFDKTKLGRWINTSRHHNLHHARFTGNYGLYFLCWDRWMGTLREVDAPAKS